MGPLRISLFHCVLKVGPCVAVCFGDTPGTRAQEPGSCFVQRQGTAFYLNGCPYRLTGTNQWYQMIHRRGTDRAGVNEVLDEMAARGMTVLRTWAFQDDAGRSDCLQCAPARQLAPQEHPTDYLNEATFRGLDELLVQASSRGIRVILTFVDNWDGQGGMRRYSLWRFGPQGVNHDAFYSDPLIRTWFKEYISRILNRVNYINGRRYRDDPTILAWELANEPRCLDALDSQCRTGTWIDSWILEMSCYVKSVDPNHLVTTGLEGFYGPRRSDGNPDSWMTQEGTDFIDNHSGPCVDFATVHVWPQNWGWEPVAQTDAALARAQAYTLRRLADGLNLLGKPVVIEEFGAPRDDRSRCPDPGNPGPTSIRDRFYRLFYGLCEDSAAPAGSCGGALNWMVYDGPSCAYDDENGVFLPEDASTDNVMTEHARIFRTCSGVRGGSADSCTSTGNFDFECEDCNANGIGDECDIAACTGDPGCSDCNSNAIPDECDIREGGSRDADANGIPDECEFGACCDGSNGICTDDVPITLCTGLRNLWSVNARCADLDPPCAGACCDLLTGDCTEKVPLGACSGAQQEWTGGATCNEAGCEAVTGACCDHDPFVPCTDNTVSSDCQCATCTWHKLQTCAEIDCPTNSIPTVGAWGLAILSLLLLIGAKIRFRPVQRT